MGRSIADVRAVVLTHAHSDHIGFAERIRRDDSVPIEIHEADAALARGEAKQKNEGGGPMRPIPLVSFLRLRDASRGSANATDHGKSRRSATGRRSTYRARPE